MKPIRITLLWLLIALLLLPAAGLAETHIRLTSATTPEATPEPTPAPTEPPTDHRQAENKAAMQILLPLAGILVLLVAALLIRKRIRARR